MKMRLLFIFILGLLPTAIFADETATTSVTYDSTSFEYGNVIYEQGKYQEAAVVYKNLLKENGPSEAVYYNLGNCNFRLNRIGEAILCFERVLYFNNNNVEALHNLNISNQNQRDKMDAIPSSIFAVWWKGFVQLFPSNIWAVLAIVFSCLVAVGMVLYRWPAFIKWQRTGFYLLAAALVLAVICLIGAAGNKQYLKNNQYAILVTPDATLKSTASENAENVELIHEGIKVKIVDDNGDWISVKLPNGVNGWLHSYQIEKINPFALTENSQQP